MRNYLCAAALLAGAIVIAGCSHSTDPKTLAAQRAAKLASERPQIMAEMNQIQNNPSLSARQKSQAIAMMQRALASASQPGGRPPAQPNNPKQSPGK